MAVKEVSMSPELEEVAKEFNQNPNWVRVYFNQDNDFIWWEDEFTCPKANHITYQNNPHIVYLFEKGNPEKKSDCCCCGKEITAGDIVEKANAQLAKQ